MRLKKREIWKTIPDFPDYSVSNEGRVKNKKTERILKSCFYKTGYLYVCLSNKGEHTGKLIHRLVLETFIGPCPNNHCGHHKDEIKSNNFLINLEYLLRSKHNSMHKLGTKHSEETKQKISEKGKGRIFSKEHRQNISKANKGKIVVISEEQKQKISNSLKGRIFSEEHRKKLSEAGKGRVLSKESRQKIGEAHKGRIISEEQRRKISESNKRRRTKNVNQ